MLKVLIAHAYSTMNRGDGLLVDLARDVVTDAFRNDVSLRVLALDAESFADRNHVLQYPPANSGFFSKAGGLSRITVSTALGAASLAGIFPPDFGRPDLVVGVGGGYLRTDGGIKSLKALVAHGLQMRWLLSLGVPTFYLPQSVGPLTNVEGKLIQAWVGKLDRINVRDDRSLKLLASLNNVRRTPDLAVLSIARELSVSLASAVGARAGPRLIARHLQRDVSITRNYESKLKCLLQEVEGLQPALQSSGRGNDDPAFYKGMGWGEDAPFLRDLIANRTLPSLVISVRLHGALEAIRAGIPAIHLSYERKGFGAYDDLGVSEFVHNANSFNLETVISQSKQILRDPKIFWRKIEQRLPAIQLEYDEMVSDLQKLVFTRLP